MPNPVLTPYATYLELMISSIKSRDAYTLFQDSGVRSMLYPGWDNWYKVSGVNVLPSRRITCDIFKQSSLYIRKWNEILLSLNMKAK